MKFCINRNCGLDERQLLMRGNVFQHTMILYMALILVNGFLKDCGIVWAQGFGEGMILFWAGAVLAMSEYILLDILPKDGRNAAVYILEGVCGVVLLLLSLTDLAAGKPFAEDGALTHDGCHLVIGGLMTFILLVFLAKRLFDHCRGAQEEE